MKRDLKPFVVEVKRGTRRTSFLELADQASSMSEAQRRAEAALFMPTSEDVAVKSAPVEETRRILPSLIEPEIGRGVSIDEELDGPPERRPRPVGRPRKSKLTPLTADQSSLPPADAAPAPIAAPAFVDIAPVAGAGASTTQTPSTRAPSPATPSARTRLRDRSSILARYVLGTQPAPGERWSRSARRQKRGGAE